MSVLQELVTARVTGSRNRALLVQVNGERARVGTGLGKRVARAAVALLPLVVVWPSAAQAIDYTFTKIADSSGPLSGPFTDPAISNAGTVVSLDIGLNLIFTGQGGEIVLGDYTIIASGSGPFTFLGIPTINASNTVAFGGSLDIGGSGIFTGQGGETVIGDYTTIADTSDPFAAFATNSAFINDVGTVAFLAFPNTGGEGVFIGNGGPITTIADTSGPFSDFGGTFLGIASINSASVVAFEADLDAGGSGIFTGSGGAVTTTADTSGPFSQFFNGEGAPIINDGGTVVFFAALDAGGSGIFTGSGGAATTIADTSGPYSLFFRSPTINNAGTVAFHAFLDGGGEGVFTGPDPIADKVITDGDSLFGSTVVGQSFGPQGINDLGQLTFIVFLADGREIVVRADPLTIDAAAFLVDFDQLIEDFQSADPLQPIAAEDLPGPFEVLRDLLLTAGDLLGALDQKLVVFDRPVLQIFISSLCSAAGGACITLDLNTVPGCFLSPDPDACSFQADTNSGRINPLFQTYVFDILINDEQSELTFFELGDQFITTFPFFSVEPSFGIIELVDIVSNNTFETLVFRVEGLNQLPEPVGIDVKPRRRRNIIELEDDDDDEDCEDDDRLRVALLGTPDFDALTVDELTVELGDPALGGTATPIRSRTRDVNRDGFDDLLLIFTICDLVTSDALDPNSTTLVLTGATFDGTPIIGGDSVEVLVDD